MELISSSPWVFFNRTVRFVSGEHEWNVNWYQMFENLVRVGRDCIVYVELARATYILRYGIIYIWCVYSVQPTLCTH